MGSCEVCETLSSERFDDEPAQGRESYFSFTVRNESAEGHETFEFCSWECLKLFMPPSIAGDVEVEA